MRIIRIGILLSIAIFAIHFNSCGTPVNKNVKDKVKSFEELTGRKITSRIRFANLKGRTVGLCIYGLNHVYLDKVYYDSASDIQRTALIYHELGHCECLSGHVDPKEFSFCPDSIMNATTTTDWCNRIKWNQYKTDLRKRCQK